MNSITTTNSPHKQKNILGCIGFTLWNAEEMQGETVVCGCHNGWLLKSVCEEGIWIWRHLRTDATPWRLDD